MKMQAAFLCVVLVFLSVQYGSASFRELAGIIPHPRVLRQVDQSDIKRCSNVLLQAQCSTTSYAQDIINSLSQCGTVSTASASAVEGVCRKNPRTGDYCGSLLLDRIDTIVAIPQVCGSSCTTECSTQLRSLINEAGCCATSNSAISLIVSPYLSSCSLTLPAACPRSSLSIPSPSSGSCSANDLLEIIFRFRCSRSNVQPILNALNSANCRDFASAVETDCSYRNGQYCYELFLQTSTTTTLTSAISQCTSTSSCSSACQTRIRSLNGNLGCCINSVNASLRIDTSDTLAAYRTITSYELWSTCSVTPPGECEVRLSAAASLGCTMSVMLLLTCATIFLIKYW